MKTRISLVAVVMLGLLMLSTISAQDSRPKSQPDAKPAKEKMAKPGVSNDPAVKALQAFIDTSIASGKIDKKNAAWKTLVKQPPAVKFTANKSYFWNMKTNLGSIKVKFRPDLAPTHVGSFMYLTMLGFYDGVKFHRVIPGFMAQGGCPQGTGRGGPGYRLELETNAKLKHSRRGIVSTARTQAPRSDGSQFFMMFGPAAHLDPKGSEGNLQGGYSVFGEIVDGIKVLDEMEKRGSKSGATSEKILIERAWVTVE